MLRHPSLHSLSREHHLALMLAQGAKRDGLPKLAELLPSDPAELARYVAAQWTQSIEPHFRTEEQVLVPAARGLGEEMDALLARLAKEHAALRTLAAALSDDGAGFAEVDAFSEALIAHVRFEERELFERLQELAPEVLEELALEA